MSRSEGISSEGEVPGIFSEDGDDEDDDEAWSSDSVEVPSVSPTVEDWALAAEGTLSTIL